VDWREQRVAQMFSGFRSRERSCFTSRGKGAEAQTTLFEVGESREDGTLSFFVDLETW
jgi:hypothetical protein